MSREYKFGEIYLTKFHPAKGSEIGKYRPSLVVSEKVNEIDDRLIMICPITSRNLKKCEFELEIGQKALKKKSLALLWYIRVVDTTRLEERLGCLSQGEIKKARALLSKFFK